MVTSGQVICGSSTADGEVRTDRFLAARRAVTFYTIFLTRLEDKVVEVQGSRCLIPFAITTCGPRVVPHSSGILVKLQ